MQKVAARIFDCSLDGVIAEEGTKFFQYCRDLPDDPAQVARTRSFYQRADLHIMSRNLYRGAVGQAAACLMTWKSHVSLTLRPAPPSATGPSSWSTVGAADFSDLHERLRR